MTEANRRRPGRRLLISRWTTDEAGLTYPVGPVFFYPLAAAFKPLRQILHDFRAGRPHFLKGPGAVAGFHVDGF